MGAGPGIFAAVLAAVLARPGPAQKPHNAASGPSGDNMTQPGVDGNARHRHDETVDSEDTGTEFELHKKRWGDNIEGLVVETRAGREDIQTCQIEVIVKSPGGDHYYDEIIDYNNLYLR